jgi:adenylate kinase family enzyme
MRVLLLTGTCGSGKSTIAGLLGGRPGWTHISEDAIWLQEYGLHRGAFGSAEHSLKREHVQQEVFGLLNLHCEARTNAALDVTLHESPPESYETYRAFLEKHGIAWAVRVLHPSLEVAIARDIARSRRPMAGDRIASLRAKFTGEVFLPDWFLDTSTDTPEQTVRRLVSAGVA